MRGTATATFFLSTTLVGLALGPYMAGQVSAMTHSLSTGVLSTLAIVPFGLIALIIAYRSVPAAAASIIERARAAGEAVCRLPRRGHADHAASDAPTAVAARSEEHTAALQSLMRSSNAGFCSHTETN